MADCTYPKCKDAAGCKGACRDLMGEVRRATDGQRAGVPEGWKLVPVEPTPEMWAAVNKLDDEMVAGGYDGKGCSIEQAWHCLLAAAPTPPVHHQQQQHEAAQGFARDRVPENRDFTSTTPPAGDAGQERDRDGCEACSIYTVCQTTACARKRDRRDVERYAYVLDCEVAAARKYLPNLDADEFKAKRRAAHDAAIAASKGAEGCGCTLREKLVGDGCQACNPD